ncbi:MAG: hypothetical protein ACR2PI_00150 [Hyphomicrobiaceae bacterium]
MASTIEMTDKPPADKAAVELPRAALHRLGPFDCAITVWRGASGHAYVHTVYSLAGCPELPPASVLLVKRDEPDAARVILKAMTVEHEAPSLNRADIRQQGALLGATEVHLHFASGVRLAQLTAMIDLAIRHGATNFVGK